MVGGRPRLTGITRFGDHRLEPPPSLRYVDHSMAQFNEESRELAVKVVYYGPALSGKTTNLQALYEKMDPKVRGRLMTLDTKDDRTLFFDMMPVFFRTPSGVKVKIKLYTVPGQVMHESTRRIVLQGSDALVFVADSRKSETASTLSYWKDMLRNLEANGLDPHAIPIVIQKNKMDLEDVRVDEFADLSRGPKVPVVPAKAIQGEGVLETLRVLLALCYRDMDRSLGLSKRFALPEKEFLGSILSRVEAR
jgi:signal recognition particle receptor subunit beta